MPEIDNIPDVSHYQGTIDWTQVPAPIALMKVSDGASVFDKQANYNYYHAKDAGKAVGMYHFAEGGDAFAEALHFLQAVNPLEQFDVLILDWEVQAADPVSWCLTFMQTVHDRCGVWPLLYINLSTLSAYNWAPVLMNSGLWVADWNNNPSGTIATSHVYVMQQYTDNGTIPGIPGRVDEDAWFGTVDQFKQYGYQNAQPQPTPEPVSEPTPTPEPVPEPTPTPTADPVPTPPVVDPPAVTPPVESAPIAEPTPEPVVPSATSLTTVPTELLKALTADAPPTLVPEPEQVAAPKLNKFQAILNAIVKFFKNLWNA